MTNKAVILTKWEPWYVVFGLPAVFVGLVLLLAGLGITDSSWAQSCFIKRCAIDAPRYPYSMTTLVGVGIGLTALGIPTFLCWMRPFKALGKWSCVVGISGFLFACVAYFFQPQPTFLKDRFNEPAAMFAVFLAFVLFVLIYSIFSQKPADQSDL
jgi:hypothetical protein